MKAARASRVAIIAVVFSILTASLAFADTIANDITVDGDNNKIMSLTYGGSSGSTVLTVSPANDDLKNGCNFGGPGTPTLVANVVSSDPTVAGTPATVTFTKAPEGSSGCGTTPTLTVSPLKAGSTTITLTQASNTTGGTFNFSGATFTVVVAEPTNSAPELTLPDGMTVEGNTLGGADVTYTGISATDAEDEDGDLTVDCDPPTGSFFALGGPHSVACSVTDSGGLSDSGTFSVTVVDTTAPVLSDVPANQSATFAAADGGAVISWTAPTADDIVDGDVTPTCASAGGLGSGDVFPLGTTQVTCAATDTSGNTATGAFDVNVTYASTGILQPINADGTSTFKLNSTVPVKVKLTGQSASHAGGNFTISLTRLGATVADDVNETTVSTSAHSGNALRYDATSDQYIFNLGTKGLSAGTYRVTVTLDDGTTRTAQFGLRK